MDYNLSKIQEERELQRALGAERAYAEYSRLEIEYSLAFVLGYLWNKNFVDTDALDEKTCETIFNNITRPSIGSIVDICHRLDIGGEIFGKTQARAAREYTAIRNTFFGHGFLYNDNVTAVIDELETVRNDLFAPDGILARKLDLIQPVKVASNSASGIRYSPDMTKHVWQCSTEIFRFFKEGNLYVMLEANRYLRVSPFIHVLNGEFYVYKSVADIMTGRTIYNRLLQTGTIAERWQDFVMDRSNDGVRRTSKNGTVLNVYQENFRNYIDIGFKKKIRDFLIKNRAAVCATVWGHGGIGKTAAVQSVCNDLSLGNKYFDYIVFASAKDRSFSYLLGNISTIDDPIDSYDQLIKCVKSTIRAEDSEGTSAIREFDGKLLLVIDDYETFGEEDQRQIQSFIGTLDTNRHKVIITTRAAAITTGERIDTQELEPKETADFLGKILELDEFSDYRLPNNVDLNSAETWTRIHEITSGRPLFIFQFAHTLVQSGIGDALARDFKNNQEAIEFLYGRIFRYLSNEAQLVFCAAGQLISETDLTNLLSKLRYVVDMDADEVRFNKCIQELVALRVVEVLHDKFFTVYSVEILNIMNARLSNISARKKGNIIQRANHVKVDKSLSVEESLLRRADEARMANSPTDVEAMYRSILNRESYSEDVRAKALRNLAGYFWSERDNKEQAIDLLKQYKQTFHKDSEVAKMLANLHWQSRNASEAISVLADYFGPNVWEKEGSPNSLELLGLWLMFRSKSIIDRLDDVEQRAATENWPDQKLTGQKHNIYQDFRSLFNRFGKQLFSRVKDRDLDRLKPGERHNIITGLYHFSGACLSFEERETAKDICQFALRNGKTGTMTREFQRRLDLVRQNGKRLRRAKNRFPRPEPTTTMSEAFAEARRARHESNSKSK